MLLHLYNISTYSASNSIAGSDRVQMMNQLFSSRTGSYNYTKLIFFNNYNTNRNIYLLHNKITNISNDQGEYCLNFKIIGGLALICVIIVVVGVLFYNYNNQGADNKTKNSTNNTVNYTTNTSTNQLPLSMSVNNQSSPSPSSGPGPSPGPTPPRPYS